MTNADITTLITETHRSLLAGVRAIDPDVSVEVKEERIEIGSSYEMEFGPACVELSRVVHYPGNRENPPETDLQAITQIWYGRQPASAIRHFASVIAETMAVQMARDLISARIMGEAEARFEQEQAEAEREFMRSEKDYE